MHEKCQGIGIFGGTGPRPYGAVSGSVPYQSVLEFCKPVSGFSFRDDQAPPRKECGDYIRNLDVYPLNRPSTYQSGYWTFGASEMALVYLEMRDYPRSGGQVEFDFVNPAGQVFFISTFSLPIPDPSWTWWFAFAWAVVGKFDATTGYSGNEIITPGNYKIAVATTWGSTVIDYQVTGTVPVPPGGNMVTIQIRKVGNGKVFSSGGDNAYAERSSITVPQGFEVYLDAVPNDGYSFQKWTNGAPESTQDPLTIIADHNGSITAYFGASVNKCPRGQSYTAEPFLEIFAVCDNGYRKIEGTNECECQYDESGNLTKPGAVTPTDVTTIALIGGGALLLGLLFGRR